MNNIEIIVQEKEKYIFSTYNRKMDVAYLTYCVMFSICDKNKKSLDVHHIVPRTCGGRNDEENLIAITKNHHTKLHNLILKSDLSDEERKNLEYAYLKRRGKIK